MVRGGGKRWLEPLRRARGILDALRLAPFEVATPEGRARERFRRATLAAITTLAAKGVSLITILISVPLTFHYLGTERYGMWMTISSLITILSFADLGIGNGLVNLLAESQGHDDQRLAIKYVSSSFFVLIGIGLAMVVFFLIINNFVSWPAIFNVRSKDAIEELNPSLTIFVICLAINIPLGLVEKVRTGLQEGFQNNLWQGAGNILALAGVLLAIRFKSGLPWLVLAMAGAPILTTTVNGWFQFVVHRPWLRPNWQSFDWPATWRLVRLGGAFFLLQILAIVGTSSDNLIIVRLYDASTVAQYAVIQKLFSLALIPHYLVAPLWPAFGEALARKDYAWAERTLRRAIVLSCLFEVILALSLLLWGRSIIGFWLGASIVPSLVLLSGFAVEAVIGAYRTTVSVFLNSSDMLHAQSLLFGVASIVALTLKVLLGSYFALPGIIWGGGLAFSLVYVIPAWWLTRRLVRRMPPCECNLVA